MSEVAANQGQNHKSTANYRRRECAGMGTGRCVYCGAAYDTDHLCERTSRLVNGLRVTRCEFCMAIVCAKDLAAHKRWHLA